MFQQPTHQPTNQPTKQASKQASKQARALKDRESFTLIELLIVIAILAVLAVAVVLVLNPAELLKQSRDSIRLSDLQNINQSLSLLQVDCPACSFGSSSVVYVSIPDTSPTCANLGLPSLPSGWSYRCVTTSTLQKVDGTGWIPVDFTKFSSGSPLAKLPVDPINTTSSRNYYTYTPGGSWELAGSLEAAKNKMGGAGDRTSQDGGQYPNLYEVGSNLTLLPVDYSEASLVGYWKFDEGSGSTAYDASGSGNTGTLVNGPTWVTGKVKGALSFDGVDDFVNVLNSSSVDITGNITYMAWVYLDAAPGTNIYRVISRGIDGGYSMSVGASDGADALQCSIRTPNGARIKLLGYISSVLNTWGHLACVYDGSALRLYINGAEISSASASGQNNGGSYSTNLTIGANWIGSQQLFGKMDDVRLYNRALSAAEIQAIYNATK